MYTGLKVDEYLAGLSSTFKLVPQTRGVVCVKLIPSASNVVLRIP